MKAVKKLLRRASSFLVEKLRPDQTGKWNRELHQELTALSGGRRDAVREYYIKKTEQVFLILFAGSLAAAAGFLSARIQDRSIEDRILTRPGYGEGDRSEELTVQIEGGQEQTLDLTVQERKYTAQEQSELLEQASALLDTIIPGENTSMDEVRQSLVLPETLLDGVVRAEWTTDPYGIIGDDGSITAVDDEGTLVELQGVLSCGEQEAVYTAFARVYPPVLSEQEQIRRMVEEKAGNADERDKYKETVTLPAEVENLSVAWAHPYENPAGTIFLLALLAAFCVYAGRDQAVHRKAEARRQQLITDYPDLMWKMAMLIEAGLTIKGTFDRIALQYQEQRPYRQRYAYEEIVGTCYEMQSGIAESEAYERFGRRCGLPEYIRLGSYLAQNLKKGSRGLTEFLEQEASSSLEDRKNHARKLGEQAGTKLLFPMMLMLGVVLVILMVPAFLSF